jgi:hypothetical protein
MQELSELESKIQNETMEDLLSGAKFTVEKFQGKYAEVCQDVR